MTNAVQITNGFWAHYHFRCTHQPVCTHHLGGTHHFRHTHHPVCTHHLGGLITVGTLTILCALTTLEDSSLQAHSPPCVHLPPWDTHHFRHTHRPVCTHHIRETHNFRHTRHSVCTHYLVRLINLGSLTTQRELTTLRRLITVGTLTT